MRSEPDRCRVVVGEPAQAQIRRPEDDKLVARGQVRLQNIDA